MVFLSSASSGFIADIVHALFSSFESTVVIILWIVAIVPGMIYSVSSYNPRDCIGELSKYLMWLIVGFLVLLSPLSLLLFFIYRYLYRLAKNRRSSKRSKKTTQVKSSIAPSSDQVQSHSPPVPKTNTPTNDPAYSICKFMWTRTIIFSQKLNPTATLESETYVWVSFFYAITKHIRKQDIIDEIYTQFKESARPFLCDHKNIDSSLQQMQSHYWKFRSKLNLSDIDPRTQDGLSELWKLTAQYAFPNIVPSDSLPGFTYNVKIVVDRALSLYNLSPPQESIYLIESNDGMLVRAPESKLESWQAAQDNLRANPEPKELTEAEKRIIDRITRDIYGPKEE